MRRIRTFQVAAEPNRERELRALRCAVWQRSVHGVTITLTDRAADNVDELRDRLRRAPDGALRARLSR